MKCSKKLLLCLLPLICFVSFTSQAQISYRLIPVEPPTPTHDFSVSALNNKGEIIGRFGQQESTRAFLWHDGQIVDIGGQIDPSSATEVGGINDRSQISGSRIVAADFSTDAFVFRNGNRIDINGPDGLPSSGGAINNRGQAIIHTHGAGADNRVYLWDRGELTRLQDVPAEETFSQGFGINDRGTVVGRGGPLTEPRAVMWKDGNVMELGAIPDLPTALAVGINNLEQVVINANNSEGILRSFLWFQGVTTALPGLTADPRAVQANAINEWGVVVGYSAATPTDFRAAIWIAGQPSDLTSMIAANDPLKNSVVLQIGIAINDRNQVLARGTLAGSEYAQYYLLIPNFIPGNAPAQATD